MTTHPQTRIELDYAADVDEELAPLILALWKRDIGTTMSCQDVDGRVWIKFPFTVMAEEFLDLAGTGDDDDDDLESIRCRIAPEWVPEDWQAYEERRWQYAAELWDARFHAEWDGDQLLHSCFRGAPLITIGISVTFPRTDLLEVTRRVVNAAELVEAEPTSSMDDPSCAFRAVLGISKSADENGSDT